MLRGNLVLVQATDFGYVANIKKGPTLDAYRDQGGTGFPTFASKDLDRLRDMLTRYIKGE
jgi:hypothetical protein